MSAAPDHITLSQLTQHIKAVVNSAFGQQLFWIVAEISGHKVYMNGERHYFEFVEKADAGSETTAKMRGIAWMQGSTSIKAFEQATGQQFTDGIEVLAQVKVEYQSRYGVQLILTAIDQSWTLGNLEKQRQATLARLLAENPGAIRLEGEEYITTNKETEFLPVIQRIAIIGSPNSEGFKDFVGGLDANQFGYKFTTETYQSSVQGAGAHLEIRERLVAIYQSGKAYDCVVIIRGGGAKTDFLPFDTYQLAQATARFPIPIITGIGHLTDISIVDRMVKKPTNTPTKAAGFIILHNRQFEDAVIDLHKQVTIRSQQLLANAKSRIQSTNLSVINNSRKSLTRSKEQLSTLSNRLSLGPRLAVARQHQQLENIQANLANNSRKYLQKSAGELEHLKSMIRMARPESLLKRGFAIVSQNGKPIADPKKLRKGSPINITLQQYDVEAEIIKTTKRADGAFDL